jgi:hypothetical protein
MPSLSSLLVPPPGEISGVVADAATENAADISTGATSAAAATRYVERRLIVFISQGPLSDGISIAHPNLARVGTPWRRALELRSKSARAGELPPTRLPSEQRSLTIVIAWMLRASPVGLVILPGGVGTTGPIGPLLEP